MFLEMSGSIGFPGRAASLAMRAAAPTMRESDNIEANYLQDCHIKSSEKKKKKKKKTHKMSQKTVASMEHWSWMIGMILG